MDPISIALGLAQFAPSLMRYFGAGEKSAKVVENVIGIAQTVTGAESPELALAMLKGNTERQHEFNMAVLKANTELEAAYLADTQSARNRDIELAKTGKHNYRADSMYMLAVVVIVGLVWAVLASSLDEFGKGIITLCLGRFLGYLDNMYNFEFGTTRGSQGKDATIATMAEKN